MAASAEEAIRAALDDYARLLEAWPGLSRHPARELVEDSLVLLEHLGGSRSLIDVGSGGGMPGIPLKIARPELEVTLLESEAKKTAFLLHACASLGLRGVQVVNERAERAGHGPLREAFDAAVCRALAPLPVALELCLPFVRVGGHLLVMTTTTTSVEVGPALARLGGGAPRLLPAPSPARRRGAVLVVPKVSPTPSAYPRRPGLPGRRPLRA